VRNGTGAALAGGWPRRFCAVNRAGAPPKP